MKNKNIIVIVALAIVLVGGMYFFATKDNGKLLVKDDPPIVDEQPSDDDTQDNVETDKPSDTTSPTFAVAGELAPDFTLKNLSGEEVSLSDYRGKIVMINFWATWCTWCDVEMPDMQKFDSDNDDLVVLAVDVQENIEDVKAYIEKGGYDFEVVLDPDAEVYKTYLASGFPNSYFIDAEGILLGRVPGAMNLAQMEEILGNIRNDQ